MWKIAFLFVLSCCVFAEEVRGDEDGNLMIGDECNLNEDCEDIEEAVCNSYDFCDCREGYTASQNNMTCLRLAVKIGDECQVQEQCSNIPLAQCKSNMCVVAQAVTSPPTTTRPKEECSKDSDCTSFLIKRVCRNNTCVMALPSVAPTVPGFVAIGNPCANDTDCSGEGTVCADRQCKCKESFVPAQNLKKCLQKAKAVGDSCSESAQCVGLDGSVCQNEKCTQLTKALKDIGEKISSLLIGSTCQHDNECKHMSHALCLENVCQCEDNYITSITSDSCLEKGGADVVSPGVVGTKLSGKPNSGATSAVPKLALAAIVFVKVFSV